MVSLYKTLEIIDRKGFLLCPVSLLDSYNWKDDHLSSFLELHGHVNDYYDTEILDIPTNTIYRRRGFEKEENLSITS